MTEVTDAMIQRFLSWKLPKDFSPDGGVSFAKTINTYVDDVFTKDVQRPDNFWPVGTNLLSADQTRAMLQHVLDCYPMPAFLRQHPDEAMHALAPGSQAVEQDNYSMSPELMLTLWNTLMFYSNTCSYEAERIGGVLAGCPRDKPPTVDDLIVWAEIALNALRTEINPHLDVPCPWQTSTTPPPARIASEEDARDTARYRYTRKVLCDQDDNSLEEAFTTSGYSESTPSEEQFDKVIDAALSSVEKGDS